MRIDVQAFQPSNAQRRIFRKGERNLRMQVATPILSRRRVTLWNRHREQRGLMTEHSRRDPLGYQEWLVDSCAATSEITYYLGERLVAVSLLDMGKQAANSAYHYFDPTQARHSLGVYSVLKELEWCKQKGYRWYYLGLWVRDCSALRYKTDYAPHERLVKGNWVRFEASERRDQLFFACEGD